MGNAATAGDGCHPVSPSARGSSCTFPQVQYSNTNSAAHRIRLRSENTAKYAAICIDSSTVPPLSGMSNKYEPA